MGSKTPSKAVSAASFKEPEVEPCCRPDFIYGGPFIQQKKLEPFLDTITPINLPLQGTFKRSFAYYSLKERVPIILTKVIDYLSRESSKIKTSNGASDEDIRSYIQYITKLKNDLLTNKQYDRFTVDTKDANLWNEWIERQEQPRYFTSTWLFSECYVYRRLREGCELTKGLKNFDPFEEQKAKSFTDSLEPMCMVANKLADMLANTDTDKRKADFITLLKLSLWGNRLDLSLTLGESTNLAEKIDGKSVPLVDPIQMVVDLKDKLLVDDTNKIADQVMARSQTIRNNIEAPPTSNDKSPPKSSPPPTPGEEKEEEPPQIPCPAKMTLPQSVMIDIICDNAGYEFFSDLCLAHFLVAQNIVQKVRFHVKNMPWFVSDVTPRDFKFVIDSCVNANYNRTVETEPKTVAEGEEPETAEPIVVNSDKLRDIASQWRQYVDEGTFILMSDDYWTWPHPYKDMKKYDYNLYRKLQHATALVFKGDLNYRKLIADINWNPYISFEAALQGFIPAPIIALRTVKADLICGLPKGKFDALNKIDEKWMLTGEYGVIQFCGKAEPLKVSDRPCLDYNTECFGENCPIHTEL